MPRSTRRSLATPTSAQRASAHPHALLSQQSSDAQGFEAFQLATRSGDAIVRLNGALHTHTVNSTAVGRLANTARRLVSGGNTCVTHTQPSVIVQRRMACTNSGACGVTHVEELGSAGDGSLSTPPSLVPMIRRAALNQSQHCEQTLVLSTNIKHNTCFRSMNKIQHSNSKPNRKQVYLKLESYIHARRWPPTERHCSCRSAPPSRNGPKRHRITVDG